MAMTGATSAVSAAGAVKPGAAAEAVKRGQRRPSTAGAQAEFASRRVQCPTEALEGNAGSDFMVDVIKSLTIDYVFSNPASSCRRIHESINAYGRNAKPESITCMHEESAVAMTHGYYE